jgi:hypothetical protein
LLRDLHGEDAVGELGAELLRIDGVRQRVRLGEGAVGAAEEDLVLVVAFVLALALDGENAFVKRDFEILFLEAGDIGGEDDLGFVCPNVDGRGERARGLRGAARAGHDVIEEAIEHGETIPSAEHGQTPNVEAELAHRPVAW